MNKWVPAFFNAGKVTDSLWRKCGDPLTARLQLGVSLAQSIERERFKIWYNPCINILQYTHSKTAEIHVLFYK